MRLVTNPGSNLSARVVAYYQVHLTPQKIVVDGEEHDTREPISFDTLDAWVRRAKIYPHPLGTSAAESAEIFKSLLATESELLVVTTSNKLVLTYNASVAAAKMLAPSHPNASIHVVDSGVTDIGTGLSVILAGEAIRAGLPARTIAKVVAEFASRQRSVFSIQSLDYIVKSGRASFLKAWLADLMAIVPILGFRDGEVKAIGKISRRDDRLGALVEVVTGGLARTAPVWAAVVHGGDAHGAEELLQRIRARVDVRYDVLRPLSPTAYLGGGPGTLAAFVFPLDGLSWAPTVPAVR